MIGYIYKHTAPNGKSYIGQTTKKDPNKRWRNGRGYTKSQDNLFSKAIIKYGWENFNHEILEIIEFKNIEELNNLEEKYIINLKTIVPFGYNLTTKGKNHLVSQETRNKLSEKSKGKNNPFYNKHHSKETLDKIKKTKIKNGKTWKWSEESKLKSKKIHNSGRYIKNDPRLLKRKISEETRLRMKEAALKRYSDPKERLKQSLLSKEINSRPEVKLKQSIARKKYYENLKCINKDK